MLKLNHVNEIQWLKIISETLQPHDLVIEIWHNDFHITDHENNEVFCIGLDEVMIISFAGLLDTIKETLTKLDYKT